DAMCKDGGEKPLWGDKDGRLSAETIRERILGLAAHFQAEGLGAGDLVGLVPERNVRDAVTLMALRHIGACAVLLHPRNEVSFALAGRIDDGGRFVRTGEAKVPYPDAGYVVFSSGSTGEPKAVCLSDDNFIWNLLDSCPFGCYEADDVALGALPLDHVFGLVLLLGTLVLGYRLYFPESTAPEHLLKAIREQGITRMNGVPSLYLKLAELATTQETSTLRAGFVGGGPMSEAQFAIIEASLGMTLIPVYGMSECIGIACADGRSPQEVRKGCVGRVYPMNRVRIRRADGTWAREGEEGEILVDGPSRMLGYLPAEEAREEMFPTGDLGRLTGEGLVLTGRKRDIIIRCGMNLRPRKIEEALRDIKGVMDAAVVGIPSDTEGEVPAAMVCPAFLEPAKISEQLAQVLSRLEMPVCILAADALPVTRTGKPDRTRIRKELEAWRDGQS
ncbi:MAG: long-chain fatty acid--CoA ligase, partial [Clostridia bacterium]|nr:long-chain fatty acid--CoA ligase [Clostridia bacterium]